MNLHISDEHLSIILDSEHKAFMFGSRVYGTNVAGSDVDYMLVLPTPQQRTFSLSRTIHNLQGKLDGVDYVINDTMMFFHNMINGDSTINFEILVNMSESDFDGITRYKKDFITYNLIKCYLGMVKRDLKSNSEKKFKHAVRGLQVVESLLAGNPSIDFDHDKVMTHNEAKELCALYRNNANLKLEMGQLNRIPPVEVISKVNDIISKSITNDGVIASIFEHYETDAIMNGVSYG